MILIRDTLVNAGLWLCVCVCVCECVFVCLSVSGNAKKKVDSEAEQYKEHKHKHEEHKFKNLGYLYNPLEWKPQQQKTASTIFFKSVSISSRFGIQSCSFLFSFADLEQQSCENALE